ncbi:MAG: RHS repeat domain-containing protein, partial [Pyrinomonadaceae bacterium]
GGRGMALGLSMTYNSRVWNRDDTSVIFNFEGAWLAPGWSLGYGKIIRNYNATATGNSSGVGSGNNPGDYLLVLADGTRIHLDGRLDGATGRWFHLSEDGSFLRFDPISGELSYPDGTKLIYSSINGSLLPTVIRNTNGGAITLGYRDYCEGPCQRTFRYRTALNTVRDTLGRHITFHYYGDSDYPADAGSGRPGGELAAIKAPEVGGVQREVIRVEYQTITLRYDFGRIPVDAPANGSQIKVVRRIYYPQTGRGYLFQDYSTYGMARKVSSRMGMTGAGGSITDGVEVSSTKYDYLTIDGSDPDGRNQAGSLDDFPQFTRKEEWWEGKTDNNGAATNSPTQYDYAFTRGGTTEVSTMTQAEHHIQTVVTTGADSAQLSFGKVISVEQKSLSSGAVLSRRVYTYVNGPDGGPQIETIETTNEAGESRLVRSGYGSFGRVRNLYEYGFKQGSAYNVIRRTQYDYVDDGSYITERMLRLINRVSVYDGKNDNDDGDDELKSKAENIYDDYGVMGGMESYGSGGTNFPPNHDSRYDQGRVIRGNVTGVRTYSQVSPDVSVTRNRRYDIFGNVIRAEVSCCSLKEFGFSSLTAFSQPDITKDGGGGLNLTTNINYDFFTGLVTSQTNADGLVTRYEYDEALRLERVISPTGAETTTRVARDGNGNDQLQYVAQTSYAESGESRTITTRSWFDGAGRVL